MDDHKEVKARNTVRNIKPYTPGKPIWELQQELGLSKIIKLASNENSLGPSPKALEAIAAALPDIHRYPDTRASSLRHALASKLDLAPEQFILTNGGDELITLVSEAYLEPEDEIIVLSPSFSEYEFGAHLMAARIIPVPLNEQYEIDIDALLAAVSERTKLLCICSPNNPTGTYLPGPLLQKLLDALPKRVLVLFDAAYNHYVTASDYSSGLEYVRAGYPIVVLQTFSKIYGLAGLRVGFGAAREDIVEQILKVKEPFNVNALAQTAAIAALDDDEHVLRSLELTVQGREQLYHALDELHLTYTRSMSNFVLVELGVDAKSIYEQLLSRGIIVRYAGAWQLLHHVRVSIGTQEENQALLDELTAILRQSDSVTSLS